MHDHKTMRPPATLSPDSPDSDAEYQKFITPSKNRQKIRPANETYLFRASFAMLAVSILLLGLDLTTLRQQNKAPKEKPILNQLPQPANTTNRTLIIILGNLRGGELAWSTLYDKVLDPNQADLALMIGRVPADRRTSSLYQRATYLWEFEEYDDWADAMDLINGTGWRGSLAKFLPPESDLLGGVQLPNTTSKGSGAIIFMIRWFLSNAIQRNDLTSRYDRFVLTRSDHYYLCMHDLSLLSQDDLWIPSGEDYDGITDRHLVVSSRDVLDALDILPGLLKNPERYKDCISKKHCNPESLIKMRWESMGLDSRVRRFPRMMFTCATEGDTTRWKKMSSEIVPEGVHLKYKAEYRDSHKNCKADNLMPVHADAEKVPLGKPVEERNASKPVFGGARVHLEWHPKERKDRFPSVDDRVKIYMSDWYLPPCDSSAHFRYKVHASSEALEYETVEIQQPRFARNNLDDSTLAISSEVIHHKCLFVRNSTTLQDCGRGKFGHYKSMCRDLASDAAILGADISITDTAPVLSYLGDTRPDYLAFKEGVRAPYLAKYRGATSRKDILDATTCDTTSAGPRRCTCVERRKRLRLNTIYQKELDHVLHNPDKPMPFAPIIWKLESKRHFGPHLDKIRSGIVPWEDKIPKAIWRGDVTGFDKARARGVTADDWPEHACQFIPRCSFVRKYINSNDTIDAGFVIPASSASELYNWVDRKGLAKDGVPMEEQLQYKILVSLEGNDVSSGLKWMLLSNSVVLMPPPTRTSWAMEELLQPFVHYVPMAEDGSDAEEKVQWILDNDMEARRIAERSTLFMEDMLYHPDAERDELEVKKEIMRRYRRHWQPIFTRDEKVAVDIPEGRGTARESDKQPRWTPPSCDLIPEIVEAADPFAINELRRNLALEAPTCLTRHFGLFEAAFLARPRDKHLNLHVPKAGGTTICKAVKNSTAYTASSNNCWEGSLCPLWCCCKKAKPTSCADLAKFPYDFLMNENWFDGFCPDAGRMYSVVLREPVSRAISHVNHLLRFVSHHPDDSWKKPRNWRLNLGQSNYLTWSLSAKNAISNTSASTHDEAPILFRPKEDDLEVAKESLRQMDFIIDLGFPDGQCTSLVLRLMGVSSGEEIGHKNSAGETYKESFDMRAYELMNSLDTLLYEYAKKLIRLDCDFFQKVSSQNPSLLLPKR